MVKFNWFGLNEHFIEELHKKTLLVMESVTSKGKVSLKKVLSEQ